MSINSRMNPYEVYKTVKTIDNWGVSIETQELIGSLYCSISTTQGTNIARDINYSEVTHLGLIRCNALEIKKNYLLKDGVNTYLVDKSPIASTRLTQLFLKEVVADE